VHTLLGHVDHVVNITPRAGKRMPTRHPPHAALVKLGIHLGGVAEPAGYGGGVVPHIGRATE
jgi:hypothetical protein